MENFAKLVDWLSECRPSWSAPQIGMADETKRALGWWPGNSAQGTLGLSASRAAKVKFLGCTNRVFGSPLTPQREQPGALCWSGLDIDADDNPHLSFESLLDTVFQKVEQQGSIRTSCGGRGLHVFFRYHAPYHFDPGTSPSVLSRITAKLSKPWADLIEDAGVKICKRDSRMFWLMGGANRWVYRTDFKIPTELVETMVKGNVVLADEADRVRTPENVGAFVATWLERLGVQPGPVYVGDVVARLRAFGEKVTTKSGMTGNGQTNGYIDCGPDWIQLWSYADGHAIWRDHDIDGMLGG